RKARAVSLEDPARPVPPVDARSESGWPGDGLGQLEVVAGRRASRHGRAGRDAADLEGPVVGRVVPLVDAGALVDARDGGAVLRLAGAAGDAGERRRGLARVGARAVHAGD